MRGSETVQDCSVQLHQSLVKVLRSLRDPQCVGQTPEIHINIYVKIIFDIHFLKNDSKFREQI